MYVFAISFTVDNKMTKVLAILITSCLILAQATDHPYLYEPVLKFIDIRSASDRFPVTASAYRDSLVNGHVSANLFPDFLMPFCTSIFGSTIYF